jgi:hypothetical protein
MEPNKKNKLHDERDGESERERQRVCVFFYFVKKKLNGQKFTYVAPVWGQWFVVEAEQLSDVVKIWMLND